ncbi:hypothetical protein MAPG_11443 [Magnaporthiopsis poae ATCC 64411]|uniref:Uncharacterized protein n=1 Tax=Magnaporthiopsis poae (strain ATCC 64411 / 73-15) TaxID=644358 RepID=A0A0C4EFA4_MAGP6|nr:hypothetical protein MAPG_11443 [Magnaporthiopsis poae ATCC 64411]
MAKRRSCKPIGLCYAAASRKEASLIPLPQNGGQLRYTQVRANLIHCADLGRQAFREARDADAEGPTLGTSGLRAARNLGALEDQDRAEKLANIYVSQLDRFATNCKDGTNATKKKFDDWSHHTSEFYRTEGQLLVVEEEKTEAAEETETESKELKTAFKKARRNWEDCAFAVGAAAEKLVHHVIDVVPQTVDLLGLSPFQTAPLLPRSPRSLRRSWPASNRPLIADPKFREELQVTTRNLMVWFAAAFELATLYVDVSVKHIVPNIQKLDELAALAGDDSRIPAKAMAIEIQHHLERTQGDIETMANEEMLRYGGCSGNGSGTGSCARRRDS